MQDRLRRRCVNRCGGRRLAVAILPLFVHHEKSNRLSPAIATCSALQTEPPRAVSGAREQRP